MSPYYLLLIDDTTGLGDTVPNVDGEHRPNFAVRKPRAVPISDALDDRVPDGLVDIINSAEPAVRVARVTPRGDVRPHRSMWGDQDVAIADDVELEAEGGWTVEAIESLPTIFGPQGELILATARHAAATLDSESDEGTERYNAYVTEQERQHEPPDSEALEAAQAAAENALNEVGADGYWWTYAGGCVWGNEILALAARDLFGTVRGWDQDAYDLLTTPWRRTLSHRLHPEDAELATAAA